MSTFVSPSTSDQACCVDTTKHVRYTHGMILGAGDFIQEFGYLSARDRWLARDLSGYGVVSGLDVRPRAGDNAVIEVSPGRAVGRDGRLIRVDRAQCADLREWLGTPAAKNELSTLVVPATNEVETKLRVVLGYRECPTDPGAVPGEACRSEEEWQQPLRLQDAFRLELVGTDLAPDEDDAVADFVDWLGRIPVIDGTTGATSVEDFLVAIQNAVPTLAQPPFVPAPGVTDFLHGPPPAGLRIPASRAGIYWRAAFRLWTTKLRPLWQSSWWREGPCCGKPAAGGSPAPKRPEERVLLAELTVPLTRNPLSGAWSLTPGKQVTAEPGPSPFLVHQRLLQEWLLRGPVHAPALEGVVRHPSGLPGFRIVAAGIVGVGDVVPSTDATYGDLQIVGFADAAREKLVFRFDGYDKTAAQAHRYGVQITPVLRDAVLAAGLRAVLVSVNDFTDDGFVVRVTDETGTVVAFAAGDLKGIRFSVQVTQFDV
ncbi:MAG: hypothetical protein JNL97_11040 [Verrucomicrobiales bacterium]|nr:hypothetical protein [Verrucomicrobiales bacterium]